MTPLVGQRVLVVAGPAPRYAAEACDGHEGVVLDVHPALDPEDPAVRVDFGEGVAVWLYGSNLSEVSGE